MQFQGWFYILGYAYIHKRTYTVAYPLKQQCKGQIEIQISVAETAFEGQLWCRVLHPQERCEAVPAGTGHPQKPNTWNDKIPKCLPHIIRETRLDFTREEGLVGNDNVLFAGSTFWASRKTLQSRWSGRKKNATPQYITKCNDWMTMAEFLTPNGILHQPRPTPGQRSTGGPRLCNWNRERPKPMPETHMVDIQLKIILIGLYYCIL